MPFIMGSLDVTKHFAVTSMDKSHVDICRSCMLTYVEAAEKIISDAFSYSENV